MRHHSLDRRWGLRCELGALNSAERARELLRKIAGKLLACPNLMKHLEDFKDAAERRVPLLLDGSTHALQFVMGRVELKLLAVERKLPDLRRTRQTLEEQIRLLGGWAHLCGEKRERVHGNAAR